MWISSERIFKFLYLTAFEYNVEDIIEDYKGIGQKIPGTIILCHFKKKIEKIASIVVSGLGILLAKRVMDSDCWKKETSEMKNKE